MLRTSRGRTVPAGGVVAFVPLVVVKYLYFVFFRLSPGECQQDAVLEGWTLLSLLFVVHRVRALNLDMNKSSMPGTWRLCSTSNQSPPPEQSRRLYCYDTKHVVG